jgi:hypothetical protein
VVHHYGGRPEFVVLGGLVPELLCAGSGFRHAGTTDVDVQVDLEIALGAAQTRRLELALLNAEFEPDGERVWRWKADGHERGAVVKFELLCPIPLFARGLRAHPSQSRDGQRTVSTTGASAPTSASCTRTEACPCATRPTRSASRPPSSRGARWNSQNHNRPPPSRGAGVVV